MATEGASATTTSGLVATAAVLALGGSGCLVAAGAVAADADGRRSPDLVVLAGDGDGQRVGDTVTWTNEDARSPTRPTGSGFDTEAHRHRRSRRRSRSTTAGSFAYICAIHPTMTGTVVVDGGDPGADRRADAAPTGRGRDVAADRRRRADALPAASGRPTRSDAVAALLGRRSASRCSAGTWWLDGAADRSVDRRRPSRPRTARPR